MFRIIFTFILLTVGCPLAMAADQPGEAATPGRVMDAHNTPSEFEKSFTDLWAYRSVTYEIYHHDATKLASLAYALARHTNDIDASLAPERFVAGVKGFHYQLSQVCDWLNDLAAGKSADPAMDEMILVGLLLQDKIITIKNGRIVPAGSVSHILGAAPGRQRTFADNLRHERLHILWDENPAFKEKGLQDWNNLSAEEKEGERKNYSRYAKGNDELLIEEWAIERAEKSGLDPTSAATK